MTFGFVRFSKRYLLKAIAVHGESHLTKLQCV